MDFAFMTEEQQNHWYVEQAMRIVDNALGSDDPSQHRLALLTVKDYLWYLEKATDGE